MPMIGLLKALLKNDAGFTAIEYGLIGAVSLALVGQLFSRL
jgi:Flp pilus assembly pilin Flp